MHSVLCPSGHFMLKVTKQTRTPKLFWSINITFVSVLWLLNEADDVMKRDVCFNVTLSFSLTLQSSWVISVELAIGPEEGISYLTDKGSTVSNDNFISPNLTSHQHSVEF